MTDHNNNTSLDESLTPKRIKPRYINIRENIYQALSNDATAVYIALRFEADYSLDVSPVAKNIQFLCNKAKIKKTRCKECLRELEINGLTKIQFNPGHQSTYLIADELGYFSQKTEKSTDHESGGLPGRTATDPGRTATDPGRTATDINNTSFTNNSTNKDLLSSDKPKDTKKKVKFSVDDYKKDEQFMRFYEAYPVRKKGSHAYKMWLRLNADDELIETIMKDIQERKTNDSQWIDGYCPHPGTYLNPECPGWEDEIVNRDKLKAENKQAEQEVRKEENEKRLAVQEELSRKNAEYERTKQENYNNDGKAYRQAARKVGERPEGLSSLRKKMGL